MQLDGRKNLQILSDFDKTITPHSLNGVSVWATMGIYWMSSVVSKEFIAEQKRLFEYYYPKEKDPMLSERERLLII